LDADHDRGGRPLIRAVTAQEVRPLRHRVLRPGQPFAETVYAGDDWPDTVHLGAFDGDRLVAIASLYREPRPDGSPAGGWRLRGMATDPEVRGAGFGAAVLEAAVAHVVAAGGDELWCNARLAAVGFYRRAGFAVVGDEFDVAGIGPHVVMTRAVAGSPAAGGAAPARQ
jgi:predicted GNAT family N-acyltransferase